MTVNELRKQLDTLQALGHGSTAVIVLDTRNGITESISSASLRFAKPEKSDGGWEIDAEEDTPFVALYTG